MEALEAYILGIWGEKVTLASFNDNQKKNVVWEVKKSCIVRNGFVCF